MIPRTFHHIWLGPDPLPDDHRPWIESWKRHHPQWEFRLWTEENLPENPVRPEVLDRLRAPVERADILRLEILYQHGGVYLDTDLECLRPLDPLLDGEEFVGVCHKPGRITNTAIATAAKHSLLERALGEVRPMEMYWTNASQRLKEVAGPLLLEKIVVDYPEVKLLDPPVFFPETPEEREQAIAVHHMARVWHNTTTLRAAMLRAEKRLEKTKKRLAEEEQAHKATKQRLRELEERLGLEKTKAKLGEEERAHAATRKRMKKLERTRKKERGEGGEADADAGPETDGDGKRSKREKRLWSRRSG
jgi:inositol phosphorylceramide mannosyltransferase catalytic subunit